VEQKIFITVQGGVAEVCEDTVPAGVVVEVLDFGHQKILKSVQIPIEQSRMYPSLNPTVKRLTQAQR